MLKACRLCSFFVNMLCDVDENENKERAKFYFRRCERPAPTRAGRHANELLATPV